MIQEEYKGYSLKSSPVRTPSGKWSVSVMIEKGNGNGKKTGRFYAEDGIHYILEIEAAKEGLNLGKNLIKSNLVGF